MILMLDRFAPSLTLATKLQSESGNTFFSSSNTRDTKYIRRGVFTEQAHAFWQVTGGYLHSELRDD